MKNIELLPIKGDWKTLQRWGLKRLDDVDDLFCNCELPEGWTMQVTDKYGLWKALKDEKARKRASIYHKDQWVGGHTEMNVIKDRYFLARTPMRDYGCYSIDDESTGKIIKRFEFKNYSQKDKAKADAINYLQSLPQGDDAWV